MFLFEQYWKKMYGRNMYVMAEIKPRTRFWILSRDIPGLNENKVPSVVKHGIGNRKLKSGSKGKLRQRSQLICLMYHSLRMPGWKIHGPYHTAYGTVVDKFFFIKTVVVAIAFYIKVKGLLSLRFELRFRSVCHLIRSKAGKGCPCERFQHWFLDIVIKIPAGWGVPSWL